MIIPLSNTQEIVEKSIYSMIRDNVVAHGYIPDSKLYPLTEVGQAAYNAAKKAIETSRGYSIEVFGVSSFLEKGEKTTARMVIEFDDFLPGNIGGGDVYYEWVEEESNYIMKMRPPKTSTYSFKVHLIANTHAIIRKMISLLAISLPDLGYIKTFDTGEYLFIVNQGFANYGGRGGENIEKLYLYEIRDLYAILPKVIDENIATILNIDINTLVRDETFSWPVVSDTVVYVSTGISKVGVTGLSVLGYRIKK